MIARSSVSQNKILVCLRIYVDAIFIIGIKPSITLVKAKLSKRFTTSYVGRFTHLLGLKVDRKPDRIFISGKEYTETVVENSAMGERNHGLPSPSLSSTLWGP